MNTSTNTQGSPGKCSTIDRQNVWHLVAVQLERCETNIAAGLSTFYKVGKALAQGRVVASLLAVV